MRPLYPFISAILMFGVMTTPLKTFASSKKSNQNQSVTKSEFNEIVAQGVPIDALTLALQGYQEAIAQNKVKNKRYLTVVDFNQPSTKKRLYVIDLESNKVIFNEYVSHGQGSGGKTPGTFSNKSGSHASELGLIVTDDVYQGKHGQSLRLDGIDPENANIRSRAIVVHPAYYATEAFIEEHNQLGRSWGCFAVNPEVAPAIIDIIKGGSVIYAHASTKMRTA